MMQEEHRYKRFGRWFETAGWLLALGLAAFTYLDPDPYGMIQKTKLYGISAAFGLLGILFYRLMPASSDGPIRYEAQDTALVTSMAMIALMTAFIYVRGDYRGLVFLYMVPVLLVTLLLAPRIVAAETIFSLMAVAFLHLAFATDGQLFPASFIASMAIFAFIGAIATVLTMELRRQSDKAGRLLTELSTRLDQIQTVGVIVRQVEFFPQLDTLLQRLTELVANAFNADLCAVFLRDEASKDLKLASACSGIRKHEHELLEVEENLKLFKEVLDGGKPRHFGPSEDAARLGHLVGNRRMENMIVVPLRVREKAIGVMFVANKRSGDFTRTDLDFFELLGGYVAMLIDSSLLFRSMTDERKKAEQMAKLLVGREVKMRELKDRLRDGQAREV